MTQYFKHDEVFPLIYRLITNATDKHSAFICHAAVVDALLSSTEGMEIVLIAEANNKFDLRGTASNMVAWFSKRYTEGENDYGALLERKKIANTWAYRSKQSERTASGNQPMFPDVDSSAIEGNYKLVTHIHRERNQKLVKAKLTKVLAETGRLTCECCGFDAKDQFPDMKSSIVEVHHQVMLSTYDGEMKTSLEDLSILCPTCHRAIHRSEVMTVETFKLKYFSANKSLASIEK